MDLGDIEGKWRTFGWNVYRCDGHDIGQIESKIQLAKLSNNKPNMIILDTVKGKGAAFAENKLSNHNMVVSSEDAKQSIDELKKEL
jgi:transketolase